MTVNEILTKYKNAIDVDELSHNKIVFIFVADVIESEEEFDVIQASSISLPTGDIAYRIALDYVVRKLKGKVIEVPDDDSSVVN